MSSTSPPRSRASSTVPGSAASTSRWTTIPTAITTWVPACGRCRGRCAGRRSGSRRSLRWQVVELPAVAARDGAGAGTGHRGGQPALLTLVVGLGLGQGHDLQAVVPVRVVLAQMAATAALRQHLLIGHTGSSTGASTKNPKTLSTKGHEERHEEEFFTTESQRAQRRPKTESRWSWALPARIALDFHFLGL